MSEFNVRDPETVQLNAEAEAYADLAVELMAAELDADLPFTGSKPYDESNAYLRQSDRGIRHVAKSHGLIYLGHTNSYFNHFYHALLSGYNPSEKQIQQCLEENGHNFIDDEISQLHSDHPDIYYWMDKYGYGAEDQPVHMPFVGAYAIPKQELRDMLGILFMRGQDYRKEGFGFPWWGDDIEDAETTE
jgi:hypothetical protein